MALTLITAPSVEPLTLAEAKIHLRRGDLTEDDALIKALITAVRERAELATGRALITQTWDLVLDHWSSDNGLVLPLPPLQSVTHIKYLDSGGTLTTWATTNYLVKAPAGPRAARGRVGLAYGIVWPSTYGQVGDVTVRFVAGYGSESADVPGMLKAAMLLDLGALYLDRENQIAVGSRVHDMYWSYRSPVTQRQAA